MPVVEMEAREVGSGAEENPKSAFFSSLVVDQDVDFFDLGKMADDFGVNPGNGLKFSWPVLGVVRPADPGGGVRRPLGRHAIAGRFLINAQVVPPYP